MKLIDVVKINNIFKPDMKFEDIQVGYKIAKFLKSIEDDVVFYNKTMSEIAQECAEKDGDKIKSVDNGIVISKEKIEVWKEKTSNLANMEIQITLPSFTLNDFSKCGFNLEELKILEFLVSE